MTVRSFGDSMKLALPLALALVSGCDRAPKVAPTQAPQAPAVQVDEYQAMAVDAGKDLIGKPAAALSFATLDGKTTSLGERPFARPIYLKFWATWCVPCRAQMPAFKADFERFGRDIDVIAVNTGINDDAKAIAAYRQSVPMPMPIALDDGRLSNAFRLKVTPQHIIIGRDGLVRYVGHLEDDRLHRELQAAIADAPAARQTLPTAVSPQTGFYTSVQGERLQIDGPGHGERRLLFFFSPWCESYLRKSRPLVAQACLDTRIAVTKLAATHRVQVIGIASGLSSSVSDVRRFIDQKQFPGPVVFDDLGTLFHRFGVGRFPTVLELDRDGRRTGEVSLADLTAAAARPGAPERPS